MWESDVLYIVVSSDSRKKEAKRIQNFIQNYLNENVACAHVFLLDDIKERYPSASNHHTIPIIVEKCYERFEPSRVYWLFFFEQRDCCLLYLAGHIMGRLHKYADIDINQNVSFWMFEEICSSLSEDIHVIIREFSNKDEMGKRRLLHFIRGTLERERLERDHTDGRKDFTMKNENITKIEENITEMGKKENENVYSSVVIRMSKFFYRLLPKKMN